MRLRHALIAAAALGMLLPAGQASAQQRKVQQQKVKQCTEGKGETRVQACTDLIAAGGPDVEGYYYNRSIARSGLNDCDGAYADAEKALSLKRDHYNLSQFATVMFDCKNDTERAIQLYSDAIRLAPKDANYYFNRGVAYTHLSKFELALADLNQAIRLNPRDPDYYYRRAALWVEQEDFGKALPDYDRAIALDPKMAMAYSYRGFAHAQKGDDAKALADYNRALQLEPDNADFYDNRAAFYQSRENFDRALADNDKAVALNPNATNYLGRARTWRAKGDLDKAVADADEAVKREVGTGWARLRRGVIYRYRGEYDRAIADFDQVLRNAPYDAETYVERGRAYEKKGDRVRARADFERALKERGGSFKTAHEDARAQLAALDAGPVVAAPAAPVAAAPAAPVVSASPVAPKDVAKDVAKEVVQDQGRRVALVIGNGNYAHTPKLANPSRDAQAVAASLRGIGFQSVTMVADQSREGLITALRAFAREAEKADWVMVYYAGHGIEIGGVNYLIPVDARLESDRDAALEAVSLEQILSAVDGAKKIKLVVLDACRDNPFAAQMRRSIGTRSVSRGLGRVEPEGATLVVYAAKHGQTALDGDGSNSPFAAALVKRMATPNVEINKIFRLIRDDVMDATAGRQEPFTYGSLPGREDFYFVGAR